MTQKKSFKGEFEAFQSTYRADSERAKVRYRSISALVEGLRCETQTRDFKLTVDERTLLGGTDQGPNPMELILTALGACQEITYRLYADLLGIPLDGVVVEVTGDVDLCGFFSVDDEARPGYTGIAAEVIIDSPASDDDIERLKEAVESHCPVLDIIGNATPVAVTVRKQDMAPAAMHAL
jgi:putative redox protein